MIQYFEDFCRELNSCGFSMGDGNAKGIFALIDYDWLNQDMLDTPVKWHCGDPEVDPWEWRMRVLEERTDPATEPHGRGKDHSEVYHGKIRNEGLHMHTDTEIMQIIDEAIKSVWVNEIRNDYENKRLLKEDTLKNAMYFHLRNRIGWLCDECDLRIFTEVYRLEVQQYEKDSRYGDCQGQHGK